MLTARSISAVLLSLLFAVTSIGFGMARGAAHPVNAVVICQGYATAVIYLDADGNPVEQVHLCPDAATALAGDHGAPGLPAPPHLPRRLLAAHLAVPDLPGYPHPAPPARAPPFGLV